MDVCVVLIAWMGVAERGCMLWHIANGVLLCRSLVLVV